MVAGKTSTELLLLIPIWFYLLGVMKLVLLWLMETDTIFSSPQLFCKYLLLSCTIIQLSRSHNSVSNYCAYILSFLYRLGIGYLSLVSWLAVGSLVGLVLLPVSSFMDSSE